MSESMKKILSVMPVLALVVACEATTGEQPLVGSSYRIELETQDNNFVLQAGDLTGLRAFLTEQHAGMGADILFSWDRNDPAASQLVADVNADLRGLGFVDLFEHPSPVATRDSDVIVTLRRYHPTVPGCDDPQAISSYANGPFYGFGCASLTNLAQMVADPRDLQRGRDLTPAQAAALGLGYQRIQVDEPKELQGGITEIGGGDE